MVFARLVAVLLVVLISNVMLLAQPQLPYSRIALTFVTSAEWSSPNKVFTSLHTFQGGNGEISFGGEVFEPGVGFPPDPRGLWAGPPENFHLLAQHNVPAPGLGTARFDLNFVFVQSHGAGSAVGFKSALQGTGVNATNDRAIFLGTSSSTVSLARTGSQAPGTTAGVNFSDLELPQVNASNRALFRATVTGPGITTGVNDTGLWSGDTSGNTSLVIQSGITSPTYPALQLINTNFPLQGNTSFAFTGTLSGPGVTPNTDNVVYHGTPGNWSVIAREGDDAPGLPLGTTFFNTGNNTQMSRSGTVWFVSAVAGAGINDFNNQGLWQGTPGNVQLVSREGDQVPGMPAGVTYRSSPAIYQVNDSNRIAMIHLVSEQGNTNIAGFAYLTGTAGNLTLVASHGMQAPGTPNGVAFDLSFTGFQPLLSENGAMAFSAFLTGPGVIAGVNDYGIWAYANGQMQLVARDGDTVDVDPGLGTDFRTIQTLVFPSAGFSDDGRLLWSANFTDGSQAAFYTLVAVPEPATLLAIAAPLAVVAWGLYRRKLRREWDLHVGNPE